MAITESRSLPPQFVEDLGKDYATQLTGLTSRELNTKDFQPMVAGQDQAQTDAYNLATKQGEGIGAYAPYLTQAGAYGTAQAGLSGPNAYQAFETPYQTDVLNATLQEYDDQTKRGITGIGLNAAMSGNLGGGREGVMRSEYQNKSDMNRALLMAGIKQQGFDKANLNANTAFNQQGILGADQQRMAQLVPNLYGSDVATLQGAGTNQQLYEQNILDQQREANRMAAYEPYERLGYMGAGMGNVMGGAMGQYNSSVTPNKSALENAIGIASLGYGMTRGNA